MSTPPSESSITLELEAILKRCSELLDDPEALNELGLDEDADRPDEGSDPYNRSA